MREAPSDARGRDVEVVVVIPVRMVRTRCPSRGLELEQELLVTEKVEMTLPFGTKQKTQAQEKAVTETETETGTGESR